MRHRTPLADDHAVTGDMRRAEVDIAAKHDLAGVPRPLVQADDPPEREVALGEPVPQGNAGVVDADPRHHAIGPAADARNERRETERQRAQRNPASRTPHGVSTTFVASRVSKSR